MSISKIKNCLAVVVLLGATSGYSATRAFPPASGDEDVGSFTSFALHKPIHHVTPSHPYFRDDCARRHRRGSASSDSDSDSEGGSFVKIVNQNSKGRVIGAKSQSLNLFKMAAESSEERNRAEQLVRKSHLLIAKAVDCQAKSLEAFARGASIRLESDVFVDRTGRFFQETGSACSLARDERETASVLRSMAATDLRMAHADALLRSASCSSSDDESLKPATLSKKKRQKKKC